MPFVTGLMSEYFRSRLAVTVCAVVFVAMGLAKASVWRRAVRHALVDPDSAEASGIGRRVWAAPLTSAAVAVAAAIGVPYAFVGLAFIPLVASLLDRRRR